MVFNALFDNRSYTRPNSAKRCIQDMAAFFTGRLLPCNAANA